ncbi:MULTISPECIES: exodeoxyribonuclease VII small subunit [Nitratiruptor]|uniref:Exodeoxyribonuclease VII small subunit n=1 Tax=Nitratiruptor tergarcus DSM 16512 TaxID=1069081 RepID=A0A1W1WUU6_9BACT|nr:MULTISPECIES: exodeoxyribonuclease VII small subunit [Nitratiruptor]BCD62574.1 exodeoxyribonuclease VII small subunit [Nitratiruptor sp. YY08-13]BCD66510.1 exodeoxyribonuclease VII small subunit [Nitratiruptor sp. YY08-26]SMC09985.1 Exodeoxyribonuclease VII small subunit [Nitratiruptor tergarcus DSM 16512]
MKDFESRLKKAKEILDELMKQDITLAKSVELYKEGMKQLKEAEKLLEEAKVEIEKIEKNK